MLRIKHQLPNKNYKILHDLMPCQPVQPLCPTLQPFPVTCISQRSHALLTLDLSHLVRSAQNTPPRACQASAPASAPSGCLPYLNTTSHPMSPRPPPMHSSLTTLPTAVAQSAAHLPLSLLKDLACPFSSISPAPGTTLPPEYIFVGGRGEGGGVEKGRMWGERNRWEFFI